MALRPETDSIIEFLNELLALDPYATAELLCLDVVCNEKVAHHPTIQVRGHGATSYIAPGAFRLGVLGLLNGYCGTIDEGPKAGWGPIVATYSAGKLSKFIRAEDYQPDQSE